MTRVQWILLSEWWYRPQSSSKIHKVISHICYLYLPNLFWDKITEQFMLQMSEDRSHH